MWEIKKKFTNKFPCVIFFSKLKMNLSSDGHRAGHTKGNVELRHLSTSVEFVGQFDFTEGHRSLHPVGTEVRRVGVDVHTAVTVGFRFASRHPLSIHILPAVTISWTEV